MVRKSQPSAGNKDVSRIRIPALYAHLSKEKNEVDMRFKHIIFWCPFSQGPCSAFALLITIFEGENFAIFYS